MKTRYDAGKLLMLVVVLASLSACATRDVAVDEGTYRTTVDVSGFERDDSDAPTIIYRRPGAPGLGEFDRFIIDPVLVFYSDPKMEDIAPENVGRMQDHLLEAMVEELTTAGYEVGTKSMPGTLRISFRLTGLRAPTAAPNVTAAVFPYAISVGEATVEAVFYDAVSNRLEGVVVTRARGSRWLNPSPWSTWADVREFLDGWAEGFREAVDEAHAP